MKVYFFHSISSLKPLVVQLKALDSRIIFSLLQILQPEEVDKFVEVIEKEKEAEAEKKKKEKASGSAK